MSGNTVAVLGLGLMGSALSATLAKAGFDVIGWNRTARDFDALKAANVIISEDCADVIDRSSAIIILTKNYHTTWPLLEKAAHFGGKTVIQMSTGSPEDAIALDEWITGRGGRYLDAALKRGPADFGTDRGAMFYAGSRETFDAVLPMLEALGGRQIHLNENLGSAKAFDLATFARSYIWIYGYFQALALAKEFGLEVGRTTELMLSVANSTFRYIERGAREIEAGSYAEAEFASVVTHHAALVQAIRGAQSRGLSTPLLDIVRNYMEKTIAEGRGGCEIGAGFDAVDRDRQPLARSVPDTGRDRR